MNITLESILAKLSISKIEESIHKHIQPLTKMLPDKRMGRVKEVIILGILGGQTPVITSHYTLTMTFRFMVPHLEGICHTQ